MKRQVLKLCVAMMMTACLSIPAVLASASTINGDVLSGDSRGDFDDVVPSEMEQLMDDVEKSNQSEDYINMINGKMKIIEGKEMRIGYGAKTISVPYYKQENSYYCGPATTKQTLQYINGTSPSQSTIAKALGTTSDGTDGHNIPPYLNKKQKRIKYVIATNPSESVLKARVNSDITNYDGPTIVRLEFSKGGNWEYKTKGHFMNVSGFTKNMGHYRVTDPNIGRIDSNASGSYNVTKSELLNGINDHPRQEFYW